MERNAYDELAIGTTAVLERLEVDYAVVAGYLAILLGRTRATLERYVTELGVEAAYDRLTG